MKRPRAAASRGEGGFTLVELILVMGVIFVLAAVVAPRFSDYVPALRVQKTSDQIMAWAQKTRSDAATTGLRQRLVFDPQLKEYWIEYEARPFREPDVFVKLAGSWERERLPDEVDLSLEGLESGLGLQRYLEFRPDGTAADALITISNDRGDRVSIKVVGATSRVTVEVAQEP
jgi:hypothetical protein